MQNNLNEDPTAIPFGFNNYYLPLQDSIDRFVAFCTKCVHVSDSSFLSVTHTAFCKNDFCTKNLKGIQNVIKRAISTCNFLQQIFLFAESSFACVNSCAPLSNKKIQLLH